MSRLRVQRSALAILILLTIRSANACSLSTGNFYSGDQINGSLGHIGYTCDGTSKCGAGGNLTGTTGNSAGQTVAFSLVFCVDLLDDISLNSTSAATYHTASTVKGVAITNAGRLAWLLLNEGPSAITSADNAGLQAAIWTESTQPTLCTGLRVMIQPLRQPLSGITAHSATIPLLWKSSSGSP